MLTDVEIVRELGRYTKAHHAGGFAHPLRSDLGRYEIHELIARAGDPSTIVLARTLNRPGQRRDWRGRRVVMPRGMRVAEHLARREGVPVPDLGAYDVVRAYPEDHELRDALLLQDRVVLAHQITAAGELLAWWGRGGTFDPVTYDRIDDTTVAELGEGTFHRRVIDELDGLAGWDDDYPYYSDGTWSSLSLRGFYDDPRKGVKPAEMGPKWHETHPGELDEPVRWTSLARECPELVSLAHDVADGATMERVRLLRMIGAGELARHTDITDRAHGPELGQVIRLHVPIVTHPSTVLGCVDLGGNTHELHLGAGRCWYLDARKPHWVRNSSGRERIHLTIDLIVDDRLRDRLWRAQKCA